MRIFGIDGQRGAMMVFFAVMLPIFVLFTALVGDLGRAHVHHTHLQNVADAASLAGASSIDHSGTAVLVPEFPGRDGGNGAGEGEDTAEAGALADRAAKDSIEKNFERKGDTAPVIQKELKTLTEDGDTVYFYHVKIMDHVPLLIARAFLPASILPDGVPVEAEAWVMARKEQGSGHDLYTRLYQIGMKQTPKEFVELKKAKADNRAERDKYTGIVYSYSMDANGKGSLTRTETVDTNEVGSIAAGRIGTYKYLYVEFQPDWQVDKNSTALQDFSFGNIDLVPDEEQKGVVKYDWVNFGSGKSTYTRNNLVKKLKEMYDINDEEANRLLDEITPIENIVLFNDVHRVRGKTAAELEAWEKKRKKDGGLAATEARIAETNDNPALADLVARNSKGEIAASDPLLVRIEGEDIDKYRSYSSETILYASSVRTFTFKLQADNMSDDYRPLIIYYYGPQDIDGNSSSEGGQRQSLPVTIEFEQDFKGVIFAPYSPVVIKGNGHSIRGLVIGKSFHREDGTLISDPSGSLYTSTGFYFSNVQFDDFDMLDLPASLKKESNVVLTSEKAKQVR